MQEDALFQDELHCPCEHDLFHVAASLNHPRCGVSVIYRDHAPSDDRPGIEIIGDDMRGRADNFDAPFVCLMIWFRADEGRQEGVMNVDHSTRITADKFRRKDTHVFRKHDVFGSAIGENVGDQILMRCPFEVLME